MWCAVIGRNFPNVRSSSRLQISFTGLLDRLRQPHRVEHHFLLPAAAKPAAEQMLMEGDLRSFGLQEARNLVEQAGRALGARPDRRPTCRRD